MSWNHGQTSEENKKQLFGKSLFKILIEDGIKIKLFYFT